MSAVTSKVRLYDLAKDLKIDTKRLIEEVRREGVDVSVPSNSISKELAEKIRDKYFPKKEVAVKRAVRIVKKAARPVIEEEPVVEVPEAAAPTETVEPEPVIADEEPVAAPQPPAQVVRRLAPAVRAAKPEIAPPEVLEPPPAEPGRCKSEDADAARGDALDERERRERQGDNIEREAGALERKPHEPAAVGEQRVG